MTHSAMQRADDTGSPVTWDEFTEAGRPGLPA
jgi:hypothetical protein